MSRFTRESSQYNYLCYELSRLTFKAAICLVINRGCLLFSGQFTTWIGFVEKFEGIGKSIWSVELSRQSISEHKRGSTIGGDG